MSQTLIPGEVVNVTIKGVRFERREPDGAIVVRTSDPDEQIWPLPPQAAVERVAPAEYPVQVGDIWADDLGYEWAGTANGDLFGIHTGQRASFEEIYRDHRLHLVRRKDWTAAAPSTVDEPTPSPVAIDRRAKLVANLRAAADWIEGHDAIPVADFYAHDWTVTYCAGSVAELDRVAAIVGANVTTDDSGHMHAIAEVDGQRYRAFHVPHVARPVPAEPKPAEAADGDESNGAGS